jgi:hypothetical protein
MALSRINLAAMGGGDDGGKRKRPTPLADDELKKFGVFGGSPDVKNQALYLVKKGMVGAGQIVGDKPDLSTREGITNSQGNWKPAAISAMLVKARQLGLQTPTEIMANKAAVMSSLDPRIKDAINHPAFSQIHPNFWPTFTSVMDDQYKAEAAQPKIKLVAKK